MHLPNPPSIYLPTYPSTFLPTNTLSKYLPNTTYMVATPIITWTLALFIQTNK